MGKLISMCVQDFLVCFRDVGAIVVKTTGNVITRDDSGCGS